MSAGIRQGPLLARGGQARSREKVAPPPSRQDRGYDNENRRPVCAAVAIPCYIAHMMALSAQIRGRVRAALDEASMGARRFERARGLPAWALRGILDPHREQIPSVDRAADICAALGLELKICAPKPGGGAPDPEPVEPPAAESGAHALRAMVQSVVRAETASLREDMALRLPPPMPDATRQIEVVEIAAAAGGGAEAAEEGVVGALAFRRDWLENRGLDPTRCVVIGVRGASMEPTLPDGSRILIDRASRRRRAGRLYALRTGDGLVVKRAGKGDDGWLLLSDNPAPEYAPLPWPADAVTLGEVRWMARTFA